MMGKERTFEGERKRVQLIEEDEWLTFSLSFEAKLKAILDLIKARKQLRRKQDILNNVRETEEKLNTLEEEVEETFQRLPQHPSFVLGFETPRFGLYLRELVFPTFISDHFLLEVNRATVKHLLSEIRREDEEITQFSSEIRRKDEETTHFATELNKQKRISNILAEESFKLKFHNVGQTVQKQVIDEIEPLAKNIAGLVKHQVQSKLTEEQLAKFEAYQQELGGSFKNVGKVIGDAIEPRRDSAHQGEPGRTKINLALVKNLMEALEVPQDDVKWKIIAFAENHCRELFEQDDAFDEEHDDEDEEEG